ncbi:acetylxylan esterase 2 [Pyricularia oryzae Y34]|uniref:Acetylxylan esterase 2 n=1 Tax=Pyricularia oryzae (strain Y34) TaxID=1143189 RepID=A0AA97PK58_PYRO3|nr:acetylxylan esterase 2 [Pyricularia oryzae Y34]
MVSTRRIAGLLFAAVAARALPGEISQDGSARGGPMVVDAPITPPTSCAAGVQIFVVRGSTEPSHMGRIAPVATSIRDAVPGSFITALDYPAKINAAEYFFSVHRGVSRLAKLVRDYVKMCPQGKIALVGYSQDQSRLILSITKITSINSVSPPTPVIASLQFGDPSRRANQTWNVGTVTDRNGYFPRQRNKPCGPYSEAMRSWCDEKDRWCDKKSPTGTDREVHKKYQIKYKDAAADFVKKQWESSQKPLGS